MGVCSGKGETDPGFGRVGTKDCGRDGGRIEAKRLIGTIGAYGTGLREAALVKVNVIFEKNGLHQTI